MAEVASEAIKKGIVKQSDEKRSETAYGKAGKYLTFKLAGEEYGLEIRHISQSTPSTVP